MGRRGPKGSSHWVKDIPPLYLRLPRIWKFEIHVVKALNKRIFSRQILYPSYLSIPFSSDRIYCYTFTKPTIVEEDNGTSYVPLTPESL
jgi:hypothetical protein